uniref:Protein kinase putative n=1 Tax=Albugo laibachii Nc14 TaxID=890382 RepID=F0WTH3_9STRA|nr:protein kinase putative [Albugo laibachii Nc14]|eukprot:CCA24663.1 protein kinase putative [Albugo laibachii Nc14]
MNTRARFIVLALVSQPHFLSTYVDAAHSCQATLETQSDPKIESSIIAIVFSDCISDPTFHSLLKVADFAPTETNWKFAEWRNAFDVLQAERSIESISEVIIHVQLQDIHNLVQKIEFTQMETWSYGPVLQFGHRSFSRMSQLESFTISNMLVEFSSERWVSKLSQIEFKNVTMKAFVIAKDSPVERITFDSSSLLEFPTAVLSLPRLAEINILSVVFSNPLQLTLGEFERFKSIDSVSLGNITAPTDKACVTFDYIQNVPICITDSSIIKDDDKTESSFQQASPGYRNLLTGVTISLITFGFILCLLLMAMVLYQRKRRAEALSKPVPADNLESPALSDYDTYEAVTDHRSRSFQSAFESTTAHIRNFASFSMATSAELKESDVVLQQKAGVWGLIRAEYQQKPVVILKLDSSLSKHWKTRRKTIKQLNQLSKIRHRYITQYIGFYTSASNSLHLAVEAMEEGSLRTLLLRRYLNLTWRRRLLMCLDIAKALQFLHCNSNLKSKDRMLRSTSFLCNSKYTCKIDVFDCISGIRKSEVPLLALGEGTLTGYAPEILASEMPTEASEVYMIGVVMCEISNQQVTFHERIIEQGQTLTDCQTLQTLKHGLELKASTEAPKEFQELITRCTALSPSDRPSITQIWNMLFVME